MRDQISDYLLCSIDLTNKCNLSCPYCYKETEYYDTFGSREAYSDITKENLFKLYNWVLDSNIKTDVCFQFHGGEPLIKWELITWFINSVKALGITSKKIAFGIQTNGLLLSRDKIDWLFEHNVQVGISFDGTKEQQNKNRPILNGKGSYDKIVDNLKYLLEKFPETSCQVTVEEPSSVEDSLVNITNLGFKNSIFRPVYNKKSESTEWQLEMAQRHIDLAKKIIEINKKNNKISESSIKRTIRAFANGTTGFMCHSWPCGAGNKLVAMDTNGFVYPCDIFFNSQGWSYGNIDKIHKSSFDDVIFKSEITKVLINRTSDKISACSTCSTQNSCGGGCPGVTFLHKKSIYEPDIHCTYFHHFHLGVDELITNEPINILYLASGQDLIHE